MRITRRKQPAAEGGAALEARCRAFVERCRERGVRVTAQRLAVYRALAGDTTHPTAEAVYRRLHGAMPSLSRATVYRVLESLVRDGLLRRVSTTAGAGRFDANLAPHHHVVCRLCGRMTDIPAPAPALGPLAAPVVPGFVVEEVDVRIVGRCDRCRTTAAAIPAAPGAGRARQSRGNGAAAAPSGARQGSA